MRIRTPRRVISSTPFLTLMMRGHISSIKSTPGINKFICLKNPEHTKLNGRVAS